MPLATAFWIELTSISLAVHEGLAGDVAAIGAAEHAHRQFGAARAHQPGDAENLAAIDMKADAFDDLAAGVQGMFDAPVLHLEQDLADLAARAGDSGRTFRVRPCS